MHIRSNPTIPTNPTINFSVEVFPAKNASGNVKLCEKLQLLNRYAPKDVSVTYGAAGSSQTGTLETALAVKSQLNLPITAHLSLVGQSKSDVLQMADKYQQAGIESILPLRGDMPDLDLATPFHPTKDGFSSSVVLIATLLKYGWQNIKTTAYPDRHPDSVSFAKDIDWLQRKFDAGASVALTQFFFNIDNFLYLRDACARYGFADKIVPGIIAFDDFDKVSNFAKQCNIEVPNKLKHAFAQIKDVDAKIALSAHVQEELCKKLIIEGQRDFHFYILNKTQPIIRLLELLKIPACEKEMSAVNHYSDAAQHEIFVERV